MAAVEAAPPQASDSPRVSFRVGVGGTSGRAAGSAALLTKLRLLSSSVSPVLLASSGFIRCGHSEKSSTRFNRQGPDVGRL